MKEVWAALIKAKKGEPLTDDEQSIVTLCPTALSRLHFDEVLRDWVI